tara:strand:+ start:2856 stop:3788 length:933 start_codon:yes stop_codon:yes gene_type:complete
LEVKKAGLGIKDSQLLAISQTSSGCYCIEWSSTENGPKIINHKHLSVSKGLEDKKTFDKLISSINPVLQLQESNSLSITLNSSQYILSQLKYDSRIDPQEFINWYEKNILSDAFMQIYDIYYYPLYKQETFLTLSIMKSLKRKIVKNSLDHGYELIYLSADIFSTATGVKQLFKLNDNDPFVIWKIDKNNSHCLIEYVGNEIKTYVKIKKVSNDFKVEYGVGYNDDIANIKSFLHSILIQKKNVEFDKSVFVYQTSKSIEKINQILALNKNIVKLVDLSTIYYQNQKKNKKISNMTQYSENGISLRGIDV